MRFLVLAALIVLPPAVPLAAPTGGSVTGKVQITRDGKPVTREFVFVYLERRAKTVRTKPKAVQTKIAQTGQKFHPRVRVVPMRSKVEFPNDDREEHNVFSPTEPQFDLKRFAPGKSAGQQFDFEGEYDIYCDIHLNMTAKVKVVDSDYIAEVNNNAFTLADVPPGEYKLHVWTPNTNEVIEPVTIVAGQTTTLPHPLKVPLKPLDNSGHKRKDGSAYPPCKYNTGQPCKPTDDIW
jgi:plastocyanin